MKCSLQIEWMWWMCAWTSVLQRAIIKCLLRIEVDVVDVVFGAGLQRKD